jgi:hypothetical protein
MKIEIYCKQTEGKIVNHNPLNRPTEQNSCLHVHAFHHAEMTGDMTFISSEILSMTLCKSAERV